MELFNSSGIAPIKLEPSFPYFTGNLEPCFFWKSGTDCFETIESITGIASIKVEQFTVFTIPYWKSGTDYTHHIIMELLNP